MDKKTVLLDLDNTLLLPYASFQTLHPRWREIMRYDITLWSSNDHTPVIGALLGVPWVIKDAPRDTKVKADVLIDDCGAFQRDCIVKEYHKSIDAFLTSQPNYMSEAETIFKRIKAAEHLEVDLEFTADDQIREAGGGAFVISSTHQWVRLDQETAMDMNEILIHEMAHVICHAYHDDRGHDGEFEDVYIELKEKYL